jgi:hypothetical protein
MVGQGASSKISLLFIHIELKAHSQIRLGVCTQHGYYQLLEPWVAPG